MTDLFQRDFDDLKVGETFTTRGRTVTEADVGTFAGLTGDHHPLHTDAQFAASHPFGERVAHGLLVSACAAGLVPFDPARVIALRRVRDLVFKRPVKFGDTIHVEGVVAQLSPLQEEAGLVVCDWRVRNQDDALVCRMSVDVLWRRTAAAAADDPVAESALAEFVPIPL
jgi:3-hydroxybutyryl-CoA dehydratase